MAASGGNTLPVPPSESTPLLNGEHDVSNRSFIDVVKGTGEPTWAQSLWFLLFTSYFNLLLVFVPLSAAAHYANWDAGLRFLFSFLAIMPLAKLLGESTDQLSIKLGQTLGGLLNASFGNAVEIIVAIEALVHGELRIVQTSLLGSVLSNLLLVLGMSFFADGMAAHIGEFGATGAQTSTSLMTLSCLTLVVPAAYHSAKYQGHAPFHDKSWLTAPDSGEPPNPDDGSLSGLLIISRGTSILLLLIYVAYLVFQFKTHKELFSEIQAQEGEEEVPRMSLVSACSSLIVVTVITSFCADYLVASIEETAQKYHIPKPFIGVVLLPLVSNAAEHVTSVWMAIKGKMELVISISIGSSIQIATFVIPLMVVLGWIIDQPLSLFFADFETIMLFVSVMMVNLLIQDGKSNYMEGLILMVLYVVISLAFWVS